ncbi:putative metallophosphoesterase YkuE [Lentibacillus populi]|uniref:Metallophosphoesterase YkuE n=1 Tax=Lentibacillus populi TaxID=1827502 RepID=A0A9W5X7U5_9BACI|nr:metallophosphoesterase [Lentibacillus populi]GGB63518.1 putative metallophosphoesterase YkuE [Lentibacillus populi]
MNRRSFLKKMFGSILAIFGIGGGTYYYARDIEPKMLHINNKTITSAKIPNAFHDFKIVQFSDTHIGFHYTLDQLKDLVAQINKQNPDLIVFTGDLVDEPNTYNWNHQLITVLRTLTAKQGKYWIYGNHDHGGYGTNVVKDTMEQADFQLLQNQHVTLNKDNDGIILAGIDDLMLGRPDLTKTLKQANPDLFTILLAHEPDFADTSVKYPVDIQLSGHSHGGQVRFPFIGDLYTPAYAEKYVQGKYSFNNGDLLLYVSRGIGTTRLPYRFLCKPEFNIYTLKKT